MDPAIVYILCTCTAMACCVLLLRGYFRTRAPLLLWSGLCFAFLTLENVGLFMDRIILPEVNLAFFRAPLAMIAVSLLIYGMIWETK